MAALVPHLARAARIVLLTAVLTFGGAVVGATSTEFRVHAAGVAHGTVCALRDPASSARSWYSDLSGVAAHVRMTKVVGARNTTIAVHTATHRDATDGGTADLIGLSSTSLEVQWRTPVPRWRDEGHTTHDVLLADGLAIAWGYGRHGTLNFTHVDMASGSVVHVGAALPPPYPETSIGSNSPWPGARAVYTVPGADPGSLFYFGASNKGYSIAKASALTCVTSLYVDASGAQSLPGLNVVACDGSKSSGWREQTLFVTPVGTADLPYPVATSTFCGVDSDSVPVAQKCSMCRRSMTTGELLGECSGFNVFTTDDLDSSGTYGWWPPMQTYGAAGPGPLKGTAHSDTFAIMCSLSVNVFARRPPSAAGSGSGSGSNGGASSAAGTGAGPPSAWTAVEVSMPPASTSDPAGDNGWVERSMTALVFYDGAYFVTAGMIASWANAGNHGGSVVYLVDVGGKKLTEVASVPLPLVAVPVQAGFAVDGRSAWFVQPSSVTQVAPPVTGTGPDGSARWVVASVAKWSAADGISLGTGHVTDLVLTRAGSTPIAGEGVAMFTRLSGVDGVGYALPLCEPPDTPLEAVARWIGIIKAVMTAASLVMFLISQRNKRAKAKREAAPPALLLRAQVQMHAPAHHGEMPPPGIPGPTPVWAPDQAPTAGYGPGVGFYAPLGDAPANAGGTPGGPAAAAAAAADGTRAGSGGAGVSEDKEDGSCTCAREHCSRTSRVVAFACWQLFNALLLLTLAVASLIGTLSLGSHVDGFGASIATMGDLSDLYKPRVDPGPNATMQAMAALCTCTSDNGDSAGQCPSTPACGPPLEPTAAGNCTSAIAAGSLCGANFWEHTCACAHTSAAEQPPVCINTTARFTSTPAPTMAATLDHITSHYPSAMRLVWLLFASHLITDVWQWYIMWRKARHAARTGAGPFEGDGPADDWLARLQDRCKKRGGPCGKGIVRRVLMRCVSMVLGIIGAIVVYNRIVDQPLQTTLLGPYGVPPGCRYASSQDAAGGAGAGAHGGVSLYFREKRVQPYMDALLALHVARPLWFFLELLPACAVHWQICQ